MDGGGGRDVRKLRVEEVFYGAIGKEPEQQKERDRGVKRKRKKKRLRRGTKGKKRKEAGVYTCGTKEGGGRRRR